ncbi:uncharacterized protein CC84DRAFT_1176426 [Paraphaeosphaeria sporulosa]|uniref:Uncharacterized protein n=1 Tax=Paraphaeosphaeria sporulosa TaxID=1460663 RepID=A0A177CHX9_9PLEO|nr:uncharacterized protein CC84DRAFT_1176426 [Paraphaeosphaeria sporulosa]OAG06430.1 hypothetical protein CC84DRAFT_1176426 [Paraphaeosphaeria sporulosa]
MADQPSPSLPPRKTEFFVVCGATNPIADVWMFAGFFAILHELRDNFGFSGTAWNNFPYEEYFKNPKEGKEGKSKNEVWWGYKDANLRSEPILRYKKIDPAQWINMNAAKTPNMDKKILRHIQQRKLNQGDRFNLFVIGHSSKFGGIEVGNQILDRKKLAQTLSKMKHGVQVNFAVASCWSGRALTEMRKIGRRHQFAISSADEEQMSYAISKRVTSDSYRGTPFVQAILSTIQDWHDDNTEKRQTIGEHIEYVRKYGYNKKNSHSNPQAYTNVDLHVHVLEMMYDRYVVRKQGRHIEFIAPTYPAPLSTFGPKFNVDEMPPSAGRALTVLQDEISLVVNEMDQPHPRDMSIVGLMDVAKSSSTVPAQRMHCIKRVLEDAQLFTAGLFTEIVFMYEFAFHMSDGAALGPKAIFAPDSLGGRFEEAVTWLAIMILRTCTDTEYLARILMFIKEQCYLGTVDSNAKMTMPSSEKEFTADKYLLCAEDPSERNPRIGMFLPHGENLNKWTTNTVRRYKKLRDAYKEVFGENSWKLYAPFTLEMKERWENKVDPVFEEVLHDRETEEAKAEEDNMDTS